MVIGAIYIEGTATISNSNFTANDAVAHRGAIVLNNSTDTQTIQLSNVQFKQNTAGRAGAAIFSNGVYLNTSITVDASTSFQQNTAVCCYAAGIGSAVTNSGINNSTCHDVGSGGERGAECCINGQYSDGQQCITCSDRFNCEALDTATARLPLKPQADGGSRDILEWLHVRVFTYPMAVHTAINNNNNRLELLK
jgi:predicted outer membrane repeat protein